MDFRAHVLSICKPIFGDELNDWPWSQLLGPNFFDDDPVDLFVGIGSIIWNTYPAEARKIVVGSGYASYTEAPDVRDGRWDARTVRGPRTAQALGLPLSAAITDGAVLVRAVPSVAARNVGRVCFMPHHDSLKRAFWKEVCAMASIDFIDPSDPVEDVMARIRGARVLLTEAMHAQSSPMHFALHGSQSGLSSPGIVRSGSIGASHSRFRSVRTRSFHRA